MTRSTLCNRGRLLQFTAGALVAALSFGIAGAGMAAADSQEETETFQASYDLPMQDLGNSTYRTANPVIFGNSVATATAAFDSTSGVLRGIVQIGDLSLAGHGALGTEVSPGVFMVRFLIPSIGIPAGGAPRLQGIPAGANVGANGVEVQGVTVGGGGSATVPVPPGANVSAQAEAVTLQRIGASTGALYSGSYAHKGVTYRVLATLGDSPEATFSGGRLTAPISVALSGDFDPSAPSISFAVPTSWGDVWNALG